MEFVKEHLGEDITSIIHGYLLSYKYRNFAFDEKICGRGITKEEESFLNEHHDLYVKFGHRLHTMIKDINYGINKEQVDLLRKNPDDIDWEKLSEGNSEYSVQLLRENMQNVDWAILSLHCDNKHVAKLLLENIFMCEEDCVLGDEDVYIKQLQLENWSKDVVFIRDLWDEYTQKVYYDSREYYEEQYWHTVNERLNDADLKLLLENPNMIDWDEANIDSKNLAILYKKFPENVTKNTWLKLCYSKCDTVVSLLDTDLIPCDWNGPHAWEALDALAECNCEYAVKIIKRFLNRIDWKLVSFGRVEGAIKLLMENPEKIDISNMLFVGYDKSLDLVEKLYCIYGQSNNYKCMCNMFETKDKYCVCELMTRQFRNLIIRHPQSHYIKLELDFDYFSKYKLE
jgi:hypothetical protein